jgi:hypothetical protein
MKTITKLFLSLTLTTISCFGASKDGFKLEANTAQFKGADYSNVIHVERGISLDEAFDIAESNTDIGYFFYVKGRQMVLELADDAEVNASSDPFGLINYQRYLTDSGERSLGYCRIFKQGDAVFLKKEGMWLGSAPGLADTYVKQ